jgi:hypothetical protein
MEVITIESETYKEIVSEIKSLKKEIGKLKIDAIQNNWLSSQQVQEILGISQKTWQTYRNNRMIPFSQIGQKIYVKASDLEEFLSNHSISKRGKL